MVLQSLISHNLPRIAQILRQNRVKRAYAFGSVCTEQFGPDSDIDLLIAFEDGLDPVTYAENYFAIADALEALLQHPVDLVTEPSLQNPYFVKVMNQTKLPIYEARKYLLDISEAIVHIEGGSYKKLSYPGRRS